MKVNVNTTPNQVKTNPNPQPQPQNLNNLSVEQLYQLLQQLQQKQQNDEFIVKSGMKASYVALKVEQILMLKKRVILSALGYAIPVMLDSVMLVKKDLSKQLGNINIDAMELFEKDVNNKKITGMRVILSI